MLREAGGGLRLRHKGLGRNGKKGRKKGKEDYFRKGL